MKKQFNIIAVRVLKKCEPYIRKILKENTTYFFMNEYRYDNKSKWVMLREEAKLLDDNFFSINRHNQLSINITAIVGQNGDGKSSIIELILRILNNFAYVSGFAFQRDDLVPVRGVWAELFYRVGQDICSIRCEGDDIVFRQNEKNVRKFSIEKLNRENLDFLREHTSVLFYSLISNYSLYAYNPEDLGKEYLEKGKCWIEGIFHKNDGYQTPIVLNPFRSKGNIDVNAENVLSKQRLLAMFVDKSITEIKTNETPKGFAYKLEKESKLVSKTLRRFMLQDHYSLEASFEMHYNEIVTVPRKNLNLLLDKLTCFWRLIQDCMTQNRILFRIASSIHSKIQEDNAPQGIILSKIKSRISLNFYISYLRKENQLGHGIASIIDEFTASKYELLNYSTIHRILLIYEFQKLWNDKFKELGIVVTPYEEWFTEKSPMGHAKLYVIYKSIEILETYTTQYGEILSPYTTDTFFLDGQENYLNACNGISISFKRLYKDICESKSHITLKIRQTLNFLRLNDKYNYLCINPMNIDIPNIISNRGFSNFVDFNAYRYKINYMLRNDKYLKLIDLLPPPIFDVEIIINRGNEPVLFSMLSSGERQLLNSLSQIAYHLRNIDSSLETNNTIYYEFVNLIFEEIELYFHPEFQQKYILSLLRLLSKMKFQRLKGINMCFVTHSPFILSDIPKKNVLFLNEGEPSSPMQEDTFGANIHTLLHNGFFLSNIPIGAFAQAKINSLFKNLHEGNIAENLYDEIMLVSEPILKSQLLKLYRQNAGDYTNEIKEMKKEIEELKRRLDLLK